MVLTLLAGSAAPICLASGEQTLDRAHLLLRAETVSELNLFINPQLGSEDHFRHRLIKAGPWTVNR